MCNYDKCNMFEKEYLGKSSTYVVYRVKNAYFRGCYLIIEKDKEKQDYQWCYVWKNTVQTVEESSMT